MPYIRRPSRLVLVVLGFAACAINAVGDGLEALVTRAGEEVTTIDPIRRLREDDRVLDGTKIHIPAGQSAAFLCSTDRWIELHGPRIWTLAPGACDLGDLQDLGTFRRLIADAGRYEIVSSILVRRRSVRDVNDQSIALSPRGTAVREPRPLLVWRALHQPGDKNAEYVIEITGWDAPHSVPARRADCRTDPSWGGIRVCTSPWPRKHPELNPGQSLFWKVGYRPSIAAPIVQEKKPAYFSRPTQPVLEEIEANQEKLAGLQLNTTRRSLAMAGLYAKRHLYIEALEQIRIISEREAALQVTVGDLYLTMGLTEFALRQYRTVLKNTDESAAIAAAAYGLGLSLSAIRRFEEAVDAFQQAREQYENSGYPAQAKDAQEAQEEAAMRSIQR